MNQLLVACFLISASIQVVAGQRWGSTCRVYMDPHVMTYDMLFFDHYGHGDDCLYTLSEVCIPDKLPQFKVRARNKLCWGANPPGATCVKYIEVLVMGMKVSVEMNRKVYINEIETNSITIPLVPGGMTLSIYKGSSLVSIYASFGLRVLVIFRPNWMNIYISVWNSNYRNKLCGICGNFNQNKNDDSITINGINECKEPGALSWIVPDCACDGKKNASCWKPCRNVYARKKRDEDVEVSQGSLNTCMKFMETANVRDLVMKMGGLRSADRVLKKLQHDCAFDLDAGRDHKTSRCDVFESIMDIVYSSPNRPGEWRKSFGCPLFSRDDGVSRQ